MLRMTSRSLVYAIGRWRCQLLNEETGEVNLGPTSGIQLIHVFYLLFKEYVRHSRRRQWQPTPVLLPGKSHGQRSLAGYSPWSLRVRHDLATEHTHMHVAF